MSKLIRNMVTVALGALLSSCGTPEYLGSADDTETPPDFKPSYTSSWTAEPGIDLFSRGGELVRSSLEAGMQTSMYTLMDSFPGYREAIGYPDNADRDIAAGVQSGNTEENRVGEFTVNYHITELIESHTEVTANVCDDIVHAETIDHDRITGHGFSWTVSLHNTADTPGLPGIVDTDRANHDPRARRTPNWNVFGTWKITRFTPQGLNAAPGGADPACKSWWLANHPDALNIDSDYTFRAPGVVPGVPRAPQYPEWIGPSEPQ